MDELISKKAAIDALKAIKCGLWEIDIPSPTVPEYVEHHEQIKNMMEIVDGWIERIQEEPPIQPEIVRCKDCKHNPKYEWFGCPMSHLNEKQRPETAWCWKAERREVTEEDIELAETVAEAEGIET